MADGMPRKIAAYMAANPPPPFEVWGCNWKAFELFEFMATQWRVGAGGRVGLVYSEAYRRMDELGIRKRKRRLALVDDLRVMENAVLEEFIERAKRDADGAA